MIIVEGEKVVFFVLLDSLEYRYRRRRHGRVQNGSVTILS